MSDINWTQKDLGPVDCYAEAVEAGYTGTKAQWLEEVGSVKENATAAAGSASDAAESATAAAGSATAAAASAAEALEHTQSVIADWLDDHVDPETGYVLDRTLAQSDAAAPADMVGDLKSALVSYNAYDIVAEEGTFTNGTHNGVTFSFDGSTITAVTGTASPVVAFRNVIESLSSLPDGFVAGKSYKVQYSSSDNTKLKGMVLYYKNGTNTSSVVITEDTTITIPSDATGIVVRYAVPSGQSVSNVTATMKIQSDDSNAELSTKIVNLNSYADMLAKYNCWAYFASSSTPTFSRTISGGMLSSLSVTFPNTVFRIYSDNSGLILQTEAYKNQTFTLTATGILVYDIDNNVVKTDTATNTKKGNYILLLGVGATVSGLLAPYYTNYYDEIASRPVDDALLAEKKAQMYSGTYAYTLEESAGDGKVYFNLPNLYIRVIANVSYGTMSALATELGVELKTSPGFVADCIELSSADTLVFDTSVSKCKIVGRANVTMDHIVILSQASGKVVYARQDVFPMNKPMLDMKLNFGDMQYYSNKKKYIESVAYNATAKFIFFTDIHGGEENMKRIVRFANLIGSSKLTAVINGGDTVQNKIEDGITWYDNCIDACNADVLICTGNHDQWTGNPLEPASMSTVYSAEIAPMVSKVIGIVQPSGASDNSLCYYYKDYTGIRVIVLDAMVGSNLENHYDTAQDTWFKNVLSDAKTNSLPVVCVAHAPFDPTDANVVYDSNIEWNSWKPFANLSDTTHLATGALDAVDDFIDNGGEFVCWLTGHTHHDYVLTDSDYPKQFMVNGTTANYSRLNLDGAVINDKASGMYDAFTYVGIDTTNKFIKLWRIGYNIDGAMRRKETLCYDYGNSKLMACN